nr:ATP-binding protein [Veillonella atypica]
MLTYYFKLLIGRYEKKSTIVTSNINFDEWATILHDERVANAIVDRLLHHAHVISITGDSYRPTFIIEPFYFCMYIVFIKYTVYNLIKNKLMYFLVLSGCD